MCDEDEEEPRRLLEKSASLQYCPDPKFYKEIASKQERMLFKRHLAAKVRTGQKTQSRRISKKRYREGSIQPIQENYSEKARDHIKIDRRYEQRLGDMTEEQAKAEGFASLSEFKKEWESITEQPWNPEQIVTAYEFELFKSGLEAKNE